MKSTQMPAGAPNDNLSNGYRVVSVQKTSDRTLGVPDDWYCYTIVAGKSRIRGLRRGTLAEVTEYAEECAEAFTKRSMATANRALTWSSRNRR